MLRVAVALRNARTVRMLDAAVEDLKYGAATRRVLVLRETSLDQLKGRVRKEGAGIAVVDPIVCTGEDDAPKEVPPPLEKWLRNDPRVPTIVLTDGRWLSARRLLRLAEAGVHDVLVTGECDGPALAQAICGGLETARARLVLSLLPTDAPAHLRHAVTTLLTSRPLPRNLPELGQRVFASRTQLHRTWRDAGLTSPGVFLAYLRIFLVAHLMEEEGLSLEGAARAVGYPSPGAYSESVFRRFGMRSRDLRAAGGWRSILKGMRGLT